MVTTVSRRNAAKSLSRSLVLNALVWTAAAAATLTLSACASGKKEAAKTTAGAPQTASTESSGGLVFGGASPVGGSKFVQPANPAKSSPDLNTVPTKTPVPRSTKEERDAVITGLVADRVNARYSDQTGRTQPVAVRPLVDTPEALRNDAVARIDAPPPARPAEAITPAPSLAPVEPVTSDVGPRSPGQALRRGDLALAGEGTVAANPGGFRPLGDFVQAAYSRSTLSGTLTMTGGNLSPNDRNILNTSAREQIDSRGKGVIRVIGHGNGGIERAIVAAGELQRLGVAKNNLFVGSDNITGPTEVFFSRAK